MQLYRLPSSWSREMRHAPARSLDLLVAVGLSVSDLRWLARFLRHWSIELVGFAPSIALYLSLAFCAACFDHFQRIWLLTFQFFALETFACLLAATAAFGLADGWKTGKDAARRLLTTHERDAALIGLGVVLVALLPGAVFAMTGDPAKAIGAGAVFLPRCVELWRVRDQPRPIARALGWSALSGPFFLGAAFVVILLLGAAAPAPATEISFGARLGGGFVAIYYVVVATVTAWMRTRVEAWHQD